MAGFNLGSIFGGVGAGIKSGLKYDVQFISSFIWAIEGGQDEALTELVDIAKANILEAEGVTGDILPSVIGSLLTGGDPFSGSRHQFQAWQTKWGFH